jgi:pimeloyl-ACP methyl ester carboxylesterase
MLQAALGGAIVARFPTSVHAQDVTPTPVVFAHGNEGHAAAWMTTLWRFESNGFPRDRLFAIDFTDPSARSDDAVPEPGRSSTADQLAELTAAIAAMRQRTGAGRVALVANSRGGYAVRNYLRNAGSPNVSHAVLCGVPNHGVYVADAGRGNEFNGAGPFLQGLNAGEEVVAGTGFLTLRSDGNDKYAQPDGRFIGRPGAPTGVTAEGPALRGATNLVLGQLDHREVAFHPRAFREIFRFIAGREPDRLGIVTEPRVTLDGTVTGLVAGSPTNRPLAAATVEVFRVAPETGERLGEPLHRRDTGADGRWGPATVEPAWHLELVLQAGGYTTTHIYRSPFWRSSTVVHLRPGRALDQKDAGAGAVVLMTRPRGYFGIPRDVVLLDGRMPADIAAGVPGEAVTTLRLPTSELGRPVVGLFNEERIVARAWPAAENRIAIAELTF